MKEKLLKRMIILDQTRAEKTTVILTNDRKVYFELRELCNQETGTINLDFYILLPVLWEEAKDIPNEFIFLTNVERHMWCLQNMEMKNADN